MEHVYTVHTKQIEGKTYYFVKKIMTFPELGEAANMVTGYGMHTDFEKACIIAGIDDPQCRQKLLFDFEKQNQPVIPEQLPAKPAEKKHKVEIDETVNRWIRKPQTAEVLN